MKSLRLFLLAMLALSGLAAYARTITYNVNIATTGAAVTGTITTDGNQGALQTSDFVASSLTYTVSGFAPYTTTSSMFFAESSSQLTATNAGLFFNASNPQPSEFDSTDPNSGFSFCSAPALFSTQNPSCGSNGTNSPVDTVNIQLQSTSIGFVESGEYEFAANPAANIAATPEPSSLVLLGSGILGIGAKRRRRPRK